MGECCSFLSLGSIFREYPRDSFGEMRQTQTQKCTRRAVGSNYEREWASICLYLWLLFFASNIMSVFVL